jgi:hypothetical protein
VRGDLDDVRVGPSGHDLLTARKGQSFRFGVDLTDVQQRRHRSCRASDGLVDPLVVRYLDKMILHERHV